MSSAVDEPQANVRELAGTPAHNLCRLWTHLGEPDFGEYGEAMYEVRAVDQDATVLVIASGARTYVAAQTELRNGEFEKIADDLEALIEGTEPDPGCVRLDARPVAGH